MEGWGGGGGEVEKIKAITLIKYQFCDYRLDSEQTLGFHLLVSFPVTAYMVFLFTLVL